ncbi:hypothetical protein [Maribacter sp. 2307ULW6-5]
MAHHLFAREWHHRKERDALGVAKFEHFFTILHLRDIMGKVV